MLETEREPTPGGAAHRTRSPALRPGFNRERARGTRGRRLPPEPLTREEVERLLASCGRGKTGVRNRALIAVLYRAGLRISEALALRPADVDAQAGTVRVLHGKGNRARTVGIDAGALALLERWLETRRTLGLARAGALFCTLHGRPVSASYVRQALPRLAKRAGIAKRVHPHGLRHTFASELAAENVPLRLIQTQLGHAHLTTTAIYIHQINPQEAIDRIRARPWQPRQTTRRDNAGDELAALRDELDTLRDRLVALGG